MPSSLVTTPGVILVAEMGTDLVPRLAAEPQKAKLNIFVSYARDDLDFADQLVAALGAFGFGTTIDRKGIHAAENWRRRLGELILESDAIVFVLTAASIQSPVCRWEVDEALRLKKRIVPVLAAPLGDLEPYEPLRELNYVYFYPEPSLPGSGFGSGVAFLTAALSVDVEWTREHTRVGTLAARWTEADRSADLLLRGSELARAKQWRDSRPANAPELTTLQRAFLQASEDAEQTRITVEREQLEERRRALEAAEEAERERRQALEQLSRRTWFGVAALALLTVILGGVAWFAYAQKAATEEQRGLTQEARTGLENQQKETQKATKAFRIARSETQKTVADLETQKQETRKAIDQLKVEQEQARKAALQLEIKKKEAERAVAALEGASLRLREGIKLKIAKTEKPVTATEKWYRIATDYKLAIGTYRVAAGGKEYDQGTGFLVHGGGLRREWAGRVVFITAYHVIRGGSRENETNVARASVVFPGIGENARVKLKEVLFFSDIKDLDVAVMALEGAPPRHTVPVELTSHVQPAEQLTGIAVLRWTGADGFALGLGHGVSPPANLRGVHGERMFYTHVTGPGASGAPVFDANTGNVVCLHVGSIPQPEPTHGFCTPMEKIVAAIARPRE